MNMDAPPLGFRVYLNSPVRRRQQAARAVCRDDQVVVGGDDGRERHRRDEHRPRAREHVRRRAEPEKGGVQPLPSGRRAAAGGRACKRASVRRRQSVTQLEPLTLPLRHAPHTHTHTHTTLLGVQGPPLCRARLFGDAGAALPANELREMQLHLVACRALLLPNGGYYHLDRRRESESGLFACSQARACAKTSDCDGTGGNYCAAESCAASERRKSQK